MTKYKGFVKLVGQDERKEIEGLLTDTFFLKRLDYLVKEKYSNGYHYKWYKYPDCFEVIKYTEVFTE